LVIGAFVGALAGGAMADILGESPQQRGDKEEPPHRAFDKKSGRQQPVIGSTMKSSLGTLKY
jgi:hypothetical protein